MSGAGRQLQGKDEEPARQQSVDPDGAHDNKTTTWVHPDELDRGNMCGNDTPRVDEETRWWETHDYGTPITSHNTIRIANSSL